MLQLRHRLALTSALGALLLCLAAVPSSQSADIKQTERLTYAAMLGGLHLADLKVTIDESEAGYTSDVEVVSRGVVRWVQDFRATISGTGGFISLLLPDGSKALQPLPEIFQSKWTGGEFASAITMTFDSKTRESKVSKRLYNPLTNEALSRDDMPWSRYERREKRKPVPEIFRRDAFDPMAAFIAARRQIMAQKDTKEPSKTFRVPIYDGQKRYDIFGKTGQLRNTSINGKEMTVVPVSITLEPVFGFNTRSLERINDVDSRLYFSADGRFIPIQLTMTSDIFAVVINLQNDCYINALACVNFGQEPSP